MKLAIKRPHVPLPHPDERAKAKVVALAPDEIEDVGLAARALPDPASLDASTLVIVEGEVRAEKSLVRSVLGALGRKHTVPRAIRCSALVARGYVRVGAGSDPDTRADLAWGYVPTEPC